MLTLQIPARDICTAVAPAITLAWCLVRNRASVTDDVLVRWYDGSSIREAELRYWLSFDDREDLHSVKFVRLPAEMDQDTRDLLTADVLAYNRVESTDWMRATRAQVEAAVHS